MHTHHVYIYATCKRHVEKGLTEVYFLVLLLRHKKWQVLRHEEKN